MIRILQRIAPRLFSHLVEWLTEMPNAGQMSLNTASVREQWTLTEAAIEGCARHGIKGISPWRDKLQECGVKEAAELIGDHDLRVSGLCRGGMFTLENRLSDAIMDDNRQAVDEAATIGAECLVMVSEDFNRVQRT